ncbi:hypothetical protein TCAL_02308 [Tigriopus californicus]|uniref:Phosphotransferase n=1 Tax=Tigriopus californicus TaxID=6832 RepID=A0A553NQ73_TIGCA|nr:hexokinase type 2-like [Tigriopus californicus]TRY67567.1 hypothetical protein TCAL_02308 [Tigriopus californicus]|eukprot:TCALIF_02308-PA protein Name:"Similar to Hex-t2 Hexokinase type 2 (Drosophila melanogaster)" AED:0.02 eAED:0.02 QI:136/1/1/1/0/0.5/2/360/489
MQGHNPNWRVPPKDRVLKRMESTNLQSYKPKIISEQRRKIEDLCRDLIVNNDHIHVVEQRLRQAIDKGLGKESHVVASVKCYSTYVRHLPTGEEQGQFLALDLGGTNFRVLLVDIGENKQFNMKSKIFAIPQHVMIGTGEELFDHIASCLKEFMVEHDLEATKLPLGFTFSFPCKQLGLAEGRLTTWTKGFKCSGVEGEDVVRLLQEALKRVGEHNIEVCAILNDTTGCLMSCAWKEPKCRIGLIVGTGTNACYLENIENVELWDGDSGEPRHVIVNTEWGGFGDNTELDFIRTKWDEAVDEGSLNPGKQTFEKMISGMYMGELTRQVLVDMIWEGLIFQEKDTDKLFEWGQFLTKYVSEIESDMVGDFTRAKKVLDELGIKDPSDEDMSAMRYICELVSRRAGFMASAGITALLKKMDYHDVVVAIDGSVFRYHPHFPNIMRSRISQLMGIDYKFDLMLSTDGSGRGAALVAAVLTNQEQQRQQKDEE